MENKVKESNKFLHRINILKLTMLNILRLLIILLIDIEISKFIFIK